MKVNSIDNIITKSTAKIGNKPYNISFEAIDENDCYIFEMSKPIYTDYLYGVMPYVCHGFGIEDINQIVPDSKSVTNKIDKAYTGNYIREVDTNYRLYTEPMEVAINRGLKR